MMLNHYLRHKDKVQHIHSSTIEREKAAKTKDKEFRDLHEEKKVLEAQIRESNDKLRSREHEIQVTIAKLDADKKRLKAEQLEKTQIIKDREEELQKVDEEHEWLVKHEAELEEEIS